MFTGLVQAVGVVRGMSSRGDAARIVVEAPLGPALEEGESVAVDGCCLTQVPGASPDFAADLSAETLRRTTLGDRRAGDRVHLERALRAGDRLGGHLVQGHVDLVTTVLDARPEGEGRRHRLALAPDDAAFVVPQGSVTLDGVSLTVAALGPGWLEVALVPHTLAATLLGEHAPGRRVNVELDLAGKYVLRAAALSGRVELPEGALRRLGLA